MTTRSGRKYNSVVAQPQGETADMGETSEAIAAMQELFRNLLDERKRREEEEARRREQERLEREEERRAEKERERQRREEDLRIRDQELRAQMELFAKMVESKRAESSSGASSRAADGELRVVKLTDRDDIEAYLTTFERLMSAYNIPKDRWIFKLAPQLSGKAQQAYAALTTEDALEYDGVKAAILRRYDITEETYRQRFREITKNVVESHRDVSIRLGDLANKWLKGLTTVEQVKEAIVLEQLLYTLGPSVRVWVKERKPKTALEAGQLADDYSEARKQTAKESRPGADLTSPASNEKPTQEQPNKEEGDKRSTKERHYSRSGYRNKDHHSHVTCYNCGRQGHFASRCPEKAMYCGDSLRHKAALQKAGVVEGQVVEDIVLDTGCSKTLIHHALVPQKKMLQGEAVTIRCAHGDNALYPLAMVDLVVDGVPLTVEAAVSKTLPVSVLLGTDVPELVRFLRTDSKDSRNFGGCEALMMVTRAGAKKQEVEKEIQRQKEEESDVRPTSIASELAEEVQMEEELPIEVNPELSSLDEELFSGGRPRVKLTRSQKRMNRRQHQQDIPVGALDMSAVELQKLQETDSSLAQVRSMCGTRKPQESESHYFNSEGLLFRQWIQRRGKPESAVEQLVLPTQCRKAVLQLAHEVPLAAHLGKNKTAKRILSRFYWPTLYRDVEEFCKCCRICQKASRLKGSKAPLIPLPIVTEPFRRVAMDIVGPLPRTMSGNRYILVMSDYATRYPEAVPVKAIDAEHIAEELVKIFARVGIPEEILTDQGSNFTSQLLAEIYQLLHVHPIRTTPYHPQTDGLVERFNKTLKEMLRKVAADDGANWDKWVPYLLFAYREVPQDSTGFSPFELLYGRAVRGPLDILKESWKEPQKCGENVVSYVLAMQDKLATMAELVKGNLERAQQKQKLWYDHNARQRELKPGDLVLVLLPTSSSSLTAQWKGPYPVLHKASSVNYVVDMHDTRKRERTFHINMLKKWNTPTYGNYWADVDDGESSEDDIPEWRGSEKGEPTVGDQLSAVQKSQLNKVLETFSDVMSSTPGRTTEMEHQVTTTGTRPVRLPPYRLPHAYRDLVEKEIKEMLVAGVIEPSSSEWASPIVLVGKKDGTLRLCIDYRRLNSGSLTDAYPMPRIDDLIDRLGKARYISTLDLTRGYWQVPMAKASRHLTAFTTPFGLFQFRVMPFGLQGAPATFQRLMDKVLQGLEDYAAAYIDDLVIHSTTWEEHLTQIRTVFQRLRLAGLTAKPQKCQLGMSRCVYLGHVVGSGLVQPERSKVQGVESFPTPTNKKQVRCFLGMTGYYRKFIPDYASITAPLTDLTKNVAPNQVVWTDRCEGSFQMLKSLL